MTTHHLKSWPEFFEPVVAGTKTFELRKDDRKYQAGDVLVLQEWEPMNGRHSSKAGQYTGRECTKRVTYVMHGLGSVGTIEPCKGLAMGYAILGLEDVT